MFDIGFAELVVIAIIGLLVLGPERLPHAIKTVMLWVGRLKRGFAAMKSEIEQEIGTDDIRRQLHNESIMQDLKQTQADINRQVNEFKQSIDQSVDSMEGSVNNSIAPQNNNSIADSTQQSNPIQQPNTTQQPSTQQHSTSDSSATSSNQPS